MNCIKLYSKYMSMIEVEIKIPGNLEEIRHNLKKLGAVYIKDEINSDIYFNHPNRDFANTDEALRLRRTHDQSILTYKGRKINDISKSREEINIEISNYDDMVILLEKLSFKKVLIVNKQRQYWEYRDTVITLDNVHNLGEFVELERDIESMNNLENEINEIKRIAEEIGLDPEKQIIKSYLELLLEK